MYQVFIASDNIVSPLGRTTAENFMQLRKGHSAVDIYPENHLSDRPFAAALFPPEERTDDAGTSFFERLLIQSISGALTESGLDPRSGKILLVLSTTKGNIGLLDSGSYVPERLALTASAEVVRRHFSFMHTPWIVSNACISGLVGMIAGLRLIRAGEYDHVIVAGADTVSKFILSGFQSFGAVSETLCRPFDAARNGINLGEGAGTVILSSDKKFSGGIQLRSGFVSNDANHISAPSRTGEELAGIIRRSIASAGLTPGEIDFISAHGTATVYNDEMEAKAIARSGLSQTPVNSLKGYYGHTLGAAGLIESIIAAESLREQWIVPTPGFENTGVSEPINVCSEWISRPVRHALKTASGFGGCNAAIVLSE